MWTCLMANRVASMNTGCSLFLKDVWRLNDDFADLNDDILVG